MNYNLSFRILVLLNIFYETQGQGGSCNVYHKFSSAGESALLRSPNYPYNYGNNIDCRYTLDSPQNTSMTINCTDFNVEASLNCVYDVFTLSGSGDKSVKDREYFCGQGSWTRKSNGSGLALGFHSDGSNPASRLPFRFQCTISVLQMPIPKPPDCECGMSSPSLKMKTRIVGGTDSALGEFPWRVALYTGKLGIFCAGTIISRNFILTAAHCTASVEAGDQIYVNAGDYDLSSTTDAENQVVPVDYVIQNSNYNGESQDSDIALLRLRIPLKFNENVGAACLPFKYQGADFNGQIVTASGWGTEYFGGGISPKLKKVELPIMETRPCEDLYAGSAINITENMICTYFPGRDTCQGDSGGSIDYNDVVNGRWYALGVTSHGVSCGQINQPGVYSKITRFIQWIVSNAPTENFCNV